MQLTVLNIEELDDIACKFASRLQVGDTILLDGELGSGKTEFVRLVAKHLGVKKDITSPTFCFLNSYDTSKGYKLHHFDVYRLNSVDELSDVGFDECGYNPADGVAFIEWASKFYDAMPENALHLNFTGQGNDPREIVVTTNSQKMDHILEGLANA